MGHPPQRSGPQDLTALPPGVEAPPEGTVPKDPRAPLAFQHLLPVHTLSVEVSGAAAPPTGPDQFRLLTHVVWIGRLHVLSHANVQPSHGLSA